MKKRMILAVFIIILIIEAIIPIKINASNEETENETTEKSLFNPDTTYSWEFIKGQSQGYAYNFALLTPSNVDEFESLPVVVWLHDVSGINQDGGASIVAGGFPGFLLDNDSNLEKFSAYIVCPQITSRNGQWYPSSIKKLLDKFKQNYKVDKDNIVIAGHSLGANSTVLVAANMEPGYFSKAVVFSSGYVAKISIPTKWFVGEHEDLYYTSAALRYAQSYDKDTICWLPCGHNTPITAYSKDDGSFARNSKQ